MSSVSLVCGGTYRHRKGGVYTLIGVAGARAYYIAHSDGSRWWRPVLEFLDGRFEFLSDPGPSPEELGFTRA